MRRMVMVAVILGAVTAAVPAGLALATPSVGLVRTVLARATVGPFHIQSDDFKIHSKNTTDVVVQEVTVAVGGHSGWHTHPGPAFVLVKSGRLALTRADGCTTRVFGPGEGFVRRRRAHRAERGLRALRHHRDVHQRAGRSRGGHERGRPRELRLSEAGPS